jgi:REP element-mobilizing transposase RayT
MRIRTRGRLPHWEAKEGTYFVTFRLADSLPQQVLEQFEAERDDIIATATHLGRELSPSEQARLDKLFSERIDAYLDSGAGACHLAKPQIAQMVAEALLHFHGIRYRLFAWCVMPNHVHVVFQPLPEHELPDILHSWKSFTAKRANRLLGRSAEFWQREYYDHLVRNEDDFTRVVRYLAENPLRAKLQHWPWVGIVS